MRFKLPATLNARFFIPLTVGLSLMVAGFIIVEVMAMKEVRHQVENERLVLAGVVAERVDTMLRNTEDFFRQQVARANLDPARFSNKNQAALGEIYNSFEGLIDFIILTDARGIVTGNYPYEKDGLGRDLSDDEYIRRALSGEECLFTNLYPTPRSVTPCAWIKLSIKNPHGVVTGVIFGRLDLNSSQITALMQPVGLGESGFGELVDEHGLVLTSGRPERTLTATDCHGLFTPLIRSGDQYVGEYAACEEGGQDDLIAFVPLQQATWGVVIRQPKDEALAYARSVQRRSLVVSAAAVGVSLLLMVLVDKGYIKPMRTLTSVFEEIAAGELDIPLPRTAYKELDDCICCFESLRQQLKASVAEIECMNAELEHKVELRTRELREAEQTVKRLLHQIVVAQEAERARIARELHDETSQSLTALAVMLNTVLLTPAETPDDVKEKLVPIQEAATGILDEINRIILDLRPAILDDLGLVQAIDWYAKKRLGEAGVQVDVWTIGNERRAPSEVEVMVFRIAQEAINNIHKHANASQASICVNYKEDCAVITIEDDGCGFDPEVVTANGALTNHFGLLGMQERAALIGGDLEICAAPGQSACIKLTVPYNGDVSNG